MTAPVVAVLARPPAAAEVAGDVRSALLAAGLDDVRGWPELATSSDSDDAWAVLLERADATELEAFAQLSGALPGVEGRPVAIVTTRPVTDTLKLVDAEGRLRGTAERDHHRMLTTPIVTTVGLLRAVLAAGPDPIAVLTALAEGGVSILDAAALPSPSGSLSLSRSGSASAASASAASAAAASAASVS